MKPAVVTLSLGVNIGDFRCAPESRDTVLSLTEHSVSRQRVAAAPLTPCTYRACRCSISKYKPNCDRQLACSRASSATLPRSTPHRGSFGALLKAAEAGAGPPP